MSPKIVDKNQSDNYDKRKATSPAFLFLLLSTTFFPLHLYDSSLTGHRFGCKFIEDDPEETFHATPFLTRHTYTSQSRMKREAAYRPDRQAMDPRVLSFQETLMAWSKRSDTS